jgi:hypothetical protein
MISFLDVTVVTHADTNVADKPSAFIVKAEVKIPLKLCTDPSNYNYIPENSTVTVQDSEKLNPK